MKKTLLTCLCAFLSLVGMAQTVSFTDEMIVTADNLPVAKQEATASVTINTDGTCNFLLENLIITLGDQATPVGTVNIENIPFEMVGESIKFQYTGTTAVAAGTQEGIEGWAGPMLGELPIELNATATMEKLNFALSFDLTQIPGMGYVLGLKFGKAVAEDGDADGKKYTDVLTVTINGESAVVPNTSVLYKDNGDGTANFTLKNFVLSSSDTNIPVGNINVPNMPLTKGEGFDTFIFKDVINFTEGDESALPEGFEMWFGNVLFPDGLYIELSGKVNDEKAYVNIDIDCTEQLNQIINVQFGSDEFDDMKKYTDMLIVTIDGESVVVPNTSVLYKDNGDGTANFVLKNFVLSSDDTVFPIGNINVPNMPLTKGEGFDTFIFKDVINFTEGDESALPEGMDMWYGNVLFPDGLYIELSGKVNDEKAYVNIDIDCTEQLGQIISVQFGADEFDDMKKYTDMLVVTINGISTEVPNTSVVYKDNGDGTANFTLKNFVLSGEDTNIPVGNIFVPNMPVVKGESFDTFTFGNVIYMEDGDASALPDGFDMWFGKLLFPDGLYIDLSGKINEDKAYVNIDIDCTEQLGQIINVQFGTDTFTDEEDAVRNVEVANGKDVIYDLSGRRVQKAGRGLYIVNGKKVVK